MLSVSQSDHVRLGPIGWNGNRPGSLPRRLRGCIFGVRAQPYDFGAVELVELELHLMMRAARMAMEVPAVRP